MPELLEETDATSAVATQAIARVRDNPSSFDLIITLLRNEGHQTNAAHFVSSIQQLNSALPISL